jgi:hypothetical protein
MAAANDQEPVPAAVDVDLSLTASITNPSRVSPLSTTSQPFRFLDLPLELRLKIYSLLLPARNHTIVTQIPHNGYFYNTESIPSHSATSFYPFGRSPPKSLTTYKILTENFRSEFSSLSIHLQLLLVSKQIHEEAEPVLYGARDAVWDFGMHLEALMAFWGDRSQVARACVRNVRIAREIPALQSSNGMDARWTKLCAFIETELVGLRELDLTVWSGSGSAASFPSAGGDKVGEEKRWREWEWMKELLEMDGLRAARVTWWGFWSTEGSERPAAGFDSWLAGRMVADKVARDRMVRQGVVVEGSLVVPGRAA